MNVRDWKKYLWLVMSAWMTFGLVACSGDDDPVKQPVTIVPGEDDKDPDAPEYYTLAEAYINQFCYDQMSYYYLWWKDIDTKNWRLDADPVEKINAVRYKEDRWSMAIENIKPYTQPSTTTPGTFGYDFKPYWGDETQTNVVAVVTMVYPESPAEKAGLKRGSVITRMDGKNIQNTNEDYQKLLSSPSLTLMVAESVADMNHAKELKMTSKDMYLDPVFNERVFDCGGKKVGYVFFNDFTMECCDRLMEVAKKFKQEGVTELILDLRYNGGGYVVTEELLASLLAPEAEVKAGALYQTAVYNGSDYSKALEKYYGADYSNIYFKTKHEWTYKDKKFMYDTSDANIGLTKIYALVSDATASASEAILVSMMPYLDVEIIGAQTTGKHCSGVMFEASEYYQDYEDYAAELKKKSQKDYKEFVDKFWKYYSGWKQYVGDWGLYVMVSTYADKDGNNACRPNGLVPDVQVADEPRETYPLGDDREDLLRMALTRAGYQDFTPITRSDSRHAASGLGNSINWNHQEGRRILLKPELPASFATSPLCTK